MKSKLIGDDKGRTYALVLDGGEEAAKALLDFARERRIGAAQITGIGGFSEVVLGYFDVEKKVYKRIPVKQQVEVLSMTGDIALEGDQPKVHAHLVVGTSEGAALGGHLIEARVRPTLEVIVKESPRILTRVFDPSTGLALIRI